MKGILLISPETVPGFRAIAQIIEFIPAINTDVITDVASFRKYFACHNTGSFSRLTISTTPTTN